MDFRAFARTEIRGAYFPLAAFGTCLSSISAPARHARDHEGDLTLRSTALIMGTKLGWSSASVLFESLGELPGDTDIGFRSHLSENLQRLQQAMRRLKVDTRFGRETARSSSARRRPLFTGTNPPK